MKPTNIAIAGALLCALACRASETEKKEPPAVPHERSTSVSTPTDRLAAIQKEHDEAMEKYYQLFKDAKSQEDYDKIAKKTKAPDTHAWIDGALAIANENKGDAVALDALTWVLNNAQDDRALDMIERDHMKSAGLAKICDSLMNWHSPKGRALLERILDESPHRDVRGVACFDLGKALLRDAQDALELQAEKDEKKLAERKDWSIESDQRRLLALDADKTRARGEKMLERVVSEFADVDGPRGNLGKSAKGELRELRDLVLGKTAPDIQGEDLNGVAFKLSEYRGKVVMLDFWGNW